MAKQTDKETPENHWEELTELDKKCKFPEFSTELLISMFKTSITDKNLRDQLLNEKDLDVSIVVKKIKQNTYDRKCKKKSIKML